MTATTPDATDVKLRSLTAGMYAGQLIVFGQHFRLPAVTAEERREVFLLVSSRAAEFVDGLPSWWDRQQVRLVAKRPLLNARPGRVTSPGETFFVDAATSGERTAVIQRVTAGDAALSGPEPAWWATAMRQHGPQFRLHEWPAVPARTESAMERQLRENELVEARRRSRESMSGVHPALLGR